MCFDPSVCPWCMETEPLLCCSIPAPNETWVAWALSALGWKGPSRHNSCSGLPEQQLSYTKVATLVYLSRSRMQCEDRTNLTLQVTCNFRQHGKDWASHIIPVYVSNIFLHSFPSPLVQIRTAEDLTASLLSLSPHPYPHLANSESLHLVGHGKKRREMRTFVLPSECQEAIPAAGTSLGITPRWRGKSPVTWYRRKEIWVLGCCRSRWAQVRLCAGATTECRWCWGSRSSRAWLRLQHHQPGLARASARLCLQEHSQPPAAPTNWSWLKPKLSNTGFPSSPTDLRHFWALGLGGQKGPWWQEGLFKSLNRLCAGWASLPGSWCLSKKHLPGK